MAEILQSKLVDHNGVYLAVNETAFPRWRNSCTSSRTKETKLPRRVPITMTSGQKEAIFRQAAANFKQRQLRVRKKFQLHPYISQHGEFPAQNFVF